MKGALHAWDKYPNHFQRPVRVDEYYRDAGHAFGLAFGKGRAVWGIVSNELENTHCLIINEEIWHGYRLILVTEPKISHGIQVGCEK